MLIRMAGSNGARGVEGNDYDIALYPSWLLTHVEVEFPFSWNSTVVVKIRQGVALRTVCPNKIATYFEQGYYDNN